MNKLFFISCFLLTLRITQKEIVLFFLLLLLLLVLYEIKEI